MKRKSMKIFSKIDVKNLKNGNNFNQRKETKNWVILIFNEKYIRIGSFSLSIFVYLFVAFYFGQSVRNILGFKIIS
jgi:hypothetical protein